MAPRLRIFLSSPGDVEQERLRAHLVIQKLARNYARFFAIESFLWEYEPMLASKHFQDAIDPPGTFEFVVLVLWSRLGTPLPEKTAVREYRGIDGRAPVTGTEWEFEDALRANRAHGGKGPPDLLAYRRIGGAKADLDDAAVRDEKIKQYEAMEAFWRRWFRSGEQLLAGFCEYQELDEFDHHLEADLAKLIERRIKERSLAEGAPLWLKGSPFRGLAAYGFADAPVFFGRDGETREGVTRLAEIAGRGAAFLLVTGASGAGKSSLARAGLLPALVATKAVANIGLWRRVVMRPGDAGGEPILALARALITGDPTSDEGLAELAGAYMSAEELAASLAAGGDPSFMFTRTLRELADTERSKRGLLPHEEARLVLLIDQFEELFTRSEIAAEQRTRFAEIIAALARSGVVWVIATMRSDLAYRLDDVKELGGAQFALMPPDAAQLLEIIRQSARAAGLTFDTDAVSGLGLDAMLAREAAAEPGVLPLLSVMLDDLYARDVTTGASGGVLTVASYHVLGGLRAAIGERAERKMQSLEASDAAAAQALPRVLRALVTTGAAGDTLTVRSVPLATFADGSPERRLVESLLAADARLLTAEDGGKGPELRLAHEALIENWPRAKRIVGESGNFIRVRDDVEAQRRKWEVAGRRGEFLLASGLPLAEAEDLVAKFSGEISPAVIAFVKASRGHARRRHQLVVAAAVFFLVLALAAMGATVVAYRAQREAVAQSNRAEARLLMSDSRQLLDDKYEESLLLSVEADRLDPSLTALTHLHDILESRREIKRVFGYAGEVRGMAITAHDPRLVSIDSAGGVSIRDLQTGVVVRQFQVGSKVDAFALSPDSKTVAVATNIEIQLWDLMTGQRLGEPLKGHTATIISLAFDPAGALLASGSWDSTAILWDVHSGRMLHPPLRGHADGGSNPLNKMASGVHAVAFSPASRLLATTGGDNVAILWDVTSGQQSRPSLVGHVTRPNQLFPGVDAVAFSPDGTVLATGGLDRDIRLWDVNMHREIGEPLRSHAAGVTALTFDPNGTSLFSADEGGNIQIWNLAERTPMAAPFHGHSGSVTGLAFIPSMSAFASGGKDGRIVVWNPSRNPRSLLPRLGQYLQHTHDDAPVYNPVLRRRLFPSKLAKVVYSPSGNLLASASDEGTVVIWDIQASKEIARFLAPLNQIFAVAFDHKDNVVAIGGLEDSVLLYQIHTGQTVKLPGHGRAAPALAFSPDNTMLATGTAAGTIKLWRTDNWAPIKSIGDFKTPVMFLTLLQNREIASVDLRGSLRKTSIESGVDVQTKTENRTDQRFPVVAAAGRLLAERAGSTVALWDLDAWKPFGQGSIALHSSRIESLALDADGGRIAVGQNTDVTIYRTSSGQALLPALQVGTTLSGVALSPAGNALAVAAGEPYAYVWNLDRATWVQRACEIAMRPLSRDEWQQYLPAHQYEPACMQPPAPVR